MKTFSWSRRGARPLLALLCLWMAGCASGASLARPAPEALPPGSPLRSRTLADTDAWLRHFLVGERYDSALWVLGPGTRLRPKDRLQRNLQLGVVFHEAGRYAESNRVLERAEREADLRYTKSISRGAASLLVNDRALAYVPSATEMLLIPYYRMKNYLAQGDLQGAVVEARKAGLLLDQPAEEEASCGPDALLGYLSGLVYAEAGERNDALVALRKAERRYDRCAVAGGSPVPDGLGEELVRAAHALGMTELVDSARARYGVASDVTPGGDVVIFVEHGFAAHRAEEKLLLPLLPKYLDGIESDDVDAVAFAAEQLAEHAFAGGRSRQDGSYAPAAWEMMASGAHVLELTWPSFRRDATLNARVHLVVGDSVVSPIVATDVSGALIADFERNLPTILLRTVGRGLSRYLVSQEVEQKAEKQGGETAGWIAGLLTNAVANAIEAADTRSWSLLPDRISVVRLRLPPGEVPIRLEVASGGVAHTVDLGPVRIEPGRRVLLSRRVWEESSEAHAHRTH